MTDRGLTMLGAALAISLGGLGPAIAIGLIVSSALTAIGKNPESENAIRTAMVLGGGLAEAVGIYSFVIALILCLVV